jgi:hypothetical protein
MKVMVLFFGWCCLVMLCWASVILVAGIISVSVALPRKICIARA